MAGHKDFNQLRSTLSVERQKSVEDRVRRIEGEMVLGALRKHAGMTQKEVASILGISQPTLSVQEHQTDMEISTLSRLVEAMGGSLEVIANMPNGRIRLTQFAEKTP